MVTGYAVPIQTSNCVSASIRSTMENYHHSLEAFPRKWDILFRFGNSRILYINKHFRNGS